MKRYRWIIGLLLVALLMACSSDEKTEEVVQKQPSLLNVYVYLPERPVVTRAGEDEVDPINNDIDESAINNLHIWVFNHDNGKLISYYSTEDTDQLTGGVTYQLSVSPEFEAIPDGQKPDVDVYVLANVTQYDGSTTRTQLDQAKLGENDFGLTTLVKKVPEGGLPMSAVKRGVEVVGTAPVYKIPTLKLLRAVSKVRFVFCKQKGGDEVMKITDMILKGKDEDQNPVGLPVEEYLFLDSNDGKCHPGESYILDDKSLLTSEEKKEGIEVLPCDDPSKYIYVSTAQTAQEYEDLLDKGVNGENETSPDLTQVGPFYFRETDKSLLGTIYYKVGDEAVRTKEFSMKTELGFTRNHSWIVYAYYGSTSMKVISVLIEDWTSGGTANYAVYNW